jgi:uncharacterized membrane protein SpoIIM required for sporulation
LNYCPNCGSRLSAHQNFCTSCGFDLRVSAQASQPAGANLTAARGLGRNAVVYTTQDGLLGLTAGSDATLAASLILPLPFLAAAYTLVQTGALDVYAVIWIATAGLLYDELRWRRVRHLIEVPAPVETQGSWLVPWRSIQMADWNGRTLWFSSADPSKKASVTFDHDDAPSVEWNLSSRGIRYSRKSPRLPRSLTRFWTLAILLFIASQTILILAATLPLFPGEEQMYTTILNSTKSQVVNTTFFDQFRIIYVNNIQVAWGGSLPILGTLSFGIASYNTGRVIQVIAMGTNVPSAFVLLSLYVLPHTWFEEFSYPMAAAAGLLAVTTWRSAAPSEFARRLNRGSTKFALALGGVALTLAIAGFLEVLTGYLGLGAVLLWIPIALGLAFVGKWERRRRAGSPTGSP